MSKTPTPNHIPLEQLSEPQQSQCVVLSYHFHYHYPRMFSLMSRSSAGICGKYPVPNKATSVNTANHQYKAGQVTHAETLRWAVAVNMC